MEKRRKTNLCGLGQLAQTDIIILMENWFGLAETHHILHPIAHNVRVHPLFWSSDEKLLFPETSHLISKMVKRGIMLRPIALLWTTWTSPDVQINYSSIFMACFQIFLWRSMISFIIFFKRYPFLSNSDCYPDHAYSLFSFLIVYDYMSLY